VSYAGGRSRQPGGCKYQPSQRKQSDLKWIEVKNGKRPEGANKKAWAHLLRRLKASFVCPETLSRIQVDTNGNIVSSQLSWPVGKPYDCERRRA